MSFTIPEPIAAAFAIAPAFRHMEIKSARQLGLPRPQITLIQGIFNSLSAMPFVGAMVGTQMLVKRQIDDKLFPEKSFLSQVISSGVVGLISSPFILIYQGFSVKETPMKSLMKMKRPEIVAAIVAQETAFVFGLAIGKAFAKEMNTLVGEHKVVDLIAVAVSGALSSLAGHPANTAFTRWQKGKSVSLDLRLFAGGMSRARGGAIFSVIYSELTA
ncbi:MAG: hypothetical protein KDK62_06895 [Chlamydiia bacterium]|nr:hypothetical protein [Chlamydiia bacterium]